MLALELKAAAKYLAKSSNQVESFMATISLETAQHDLDRHHQLGSGKFDSQALALPGPVMKPEEGANYSIESAIGIEAPREAHRETSAVTMQASSSGGVAGKAEEAVKSYHDGCTFGGSVK